MITAECRDPGCGGACMEPYDPNETEFDRCAGCSCCTYDQCHEHGDDQCDESVCPCYEPRAGWEA